MILAASGTANLLKRRLRKRVGRLSWIEPLVLDALQQRHLMWPSLSGAPAHLAAAALIGRENP
jgi:hypothetical protein